MPAAAASAAKRNGTRDNRRDDEVVAPGLERAAHAPEQSQWAGTFHRASTNRHRKLLHAVEHGGARGLEVGAPRTPRRWSRDFGASAR